MAGIIIPTLASRNPLGDEWDDEFGRLPIGAEIVCVAAHEAWSCSLQYEYKGNGHRVTYRKSRAERRTLRIVEGTKLKLAGRRDSDQTVIIEGVRYFVTSEYFVTIVEAVRRKLTESLTTQGSTFEDTFDLTMSQLGMAFKIPASQFMIDPLNIV